MGVSENIAAVRGDIPKHAQAFFIYFFKKFPDNLQYFKDYKGKAPDSLMSVGSFAGHTTKVVTMLLDIAAKASSADAIASEANTLVKMQVHSALGIKQFQDLFAALVPFLQETLGGSCDKAGWEAVGANVVTALKKAGM